SYLRDKTVVLVTTQVQFIKKASKVLVLDHGNQLTFGTYEQVANSGIDLLSFVQKTSEDSDSNLQQESECKRQKSNNSEVNLNLNRFSICLLLIKSIT